MRQGQERLLLGHYRMLGQGPIGRGANSVVMEGENSITKEAVAIKMRTLLNHMVRTLADKEIEFLRTNYHPNLLRYHHHFCIGNVSYLVTELCQETLSDRIRRNGRMEEGEAMRLFLEILKGYEQIRKKGYIHRDLKPENIFIKHNRPKIGDFQYCTKLRGEEMRERFNLGTPLYMSPESLEYSVYSEKSDVWSLGLILYQMLHGNSPFHSKCERQLIKEIKSPIKDFNCSPALTQILRRALVCTPQQRITAGSLKLMVSHCVSIHQQEQLPKKAYNKMMESQSNYIRFMEYIKTLASKCKHFLQQERIIFLFQYCIRMRLQLYSSLLEKGKAIFPSKQIQKLKEKHQYQLELPDGLDESDRLRFFNPKEVLFSSVLLWQTQAQLKQQLKALLKRLGDVVLQEKVARCQDDIRLVDFLLTAYVLNRMIIEGQDSLQRFHHFSHLEVILSHPQRFNLAVLALIRQKAIELKLL